MAGNPFAALGKLNQLSQPTPQNGFAIGNQIGGQIKANRVNSALANALDPNNPDPQGAFAALADVDAGVANKLQEQRLTQSNFQQQQGRLSSQFDQTQGLAREKFDFTQSEAERKALIPAERKTVKDVAGFARFVDTGERVFADAEKAPKDKKLETIFDPVTGLAQKGFVNQDGTFQKIGGQQASKSGISITTDPKTGLVTVTQGGQVKRLTEMQSKATVFASSADSSEIALDEVLAKGFNPALGIAAQEIRANLPEGMQSENFKLYNTAKMNWIMSTLRFESGAVIGQSEIDNFNRVFFPQAGDTKAVIEAKRKARKVKLDGIIIATGGGFDAYKERQRLEAGDAKGAAKEDAIVAKPQTFSGNKQVISNSIVSAAQAAGVDGGLALAIAGIESSLNPNAQNSNSSANGLFQFIKSTGKSYGLTGNDSVEDQIRAGIAFTKDNQDSLTKTLGRPPNGVETYMAHFMGLGGASRAVRMSDDTPINRALSPAQRKSNKKLLVGVKTLGEFKRKVAQKLATHGFVEGQSLPQSGRVDLSQQPQDQNFGNIVVPPRPVAPQPATPTDQALVIAPDGTVIPQAGEIGTQPTTQGQTSLDRAIGVGQEIASDVGGAVLDAAGAVGQDLANITPDQVVRQLGLTARAGAEGIASTVGILADPIGVLANLALGTNIQPTREWVSQTLTDAGVAVPEGSTEQIVQMIAQAIASGGGTVKAGQALSNAAGQTISGVGKTLAAQPTSQLIGSGTGEAASQAVAASGGGVIPQLIANVAAGNIGGSTSARAATAGQPTPTAQRLDNVAIEAAEDLNISVLTSDAFRPTNFFTKWLQSSAEKLPIGGTGKARAAQQVQRVSAIKNILRQFGSTDAANAQDAVMSDLLKTRARKIDSFVTMKNKVLDSVADAGNVPVNKTNQAIFNEIDKLEKLNSADLLPVIEDLKNFRNAINNQGIEQVELLRKQLGEKFASPDMASVKTTAEKSLNSIYPAVRDDMGKFIRDNSSIGDFNRWKFANKRLTNLVGELDKNTLKSVLKTGAGTPEDVRKLLFSQKGSDVRALYRNLSPTGQSNARAAVLFEAMEKSTTNGVLSPSRFLSNVNKMDKQFGILFKGDDLKQIRGLAKALSLTNRADLAALNPPTGQQLAIPVGAAVLADLMGGAGAALATGATLAGFSRAYETPAFRKTLVALSKVPTGTPEEARLLKRVLAATQSAGRSEDKFNIDLQGF